MFQASLCPSSGEQRPCYGIWCIMVWFCWMWLVAVVGCCLVGCHPIINFCLNMFRASLCPSSGEQRPCYCIWSVVLVLLDVVGSSCGGHCLVGCHPIINFCLNMFQASLCPSSGEQRPRYCIWCVVL